MRRSKKDKNLMLSGTTVNFNVQGNNLLTRSAIESVPETPEGSIASGTLYRLAIQSARAREAYRAAKTEKEKARYKAEVDFTDKLITILLRNTGGHYKWIPNGTVTSCTEIR